MDKFNKHFGVALPLKLSNIDTDQIVPSRYLKRITRKGFKKSLFANWKKNKNFILNKKIYKKASILVAGQDFGIGSSREHAVWALKDYGFKVILSSRFGDIFRINSNKQGLLTAQMKKESIYKLWDILDNYPGIKILVNLLNNTVRCKANIFLFSIDEYSKWRLLKGIDDISLTLRNGGSDNILKYEQRRLFWKPRISKS